MKTEKIELNKIYEGFYFFSYQPRWDVFIVSSQKRKTDAFLKRVVDALLSRGIEVLKPECRCYSFQELMPATYEARMSERWGLYHNIIGSNFGYGDFEKNRHCEIIFIN